MMPGLGWVLLAGAIVLAIAAAVLVRRTRCLTSGTRFPQAKKDFHAQREYLEARFVELTGASGKPRGLAWEECDFDDDVAYARDRHTNALSALVAVTVRFSAIEGGGMEDVEAVDNLRAATAVFHWRDGRWATEGRVLFNMNPSEAIHYYKADLELVDEEVARPV